MDVFERAREFGPLVLIPLAWTFVTAAHFEIVSVQTLFIAHVVMIVLLIGFVVTGYADMRVGVLRTWWQIITVGTIVTLCGLVGLRLDLANQMLAAVALFGWILLPAIGFVETGRQVSDGTWIYLAGAAGCLLGAVLYATGQLWATKTLVVGGLTVVGLSQTAGIFDAVFRY